MNQHLTNTMKETFVRLNEDQIELLLYCLEQMTSDFNTDEYDLCEEIIDSLTSAQVELNT